MPWQNTQMNDQRKEFAMKAVQGAESLASLCREYGVSRKTGYKWKQRALEDGLRGLRERSRRPKSSPRKLDEVMVCELVRLKMAHPKWGPKKVCQVYLKRHGSAPSVSSCHRVLVRSGLVEPRRRRARRVGGRLEAAVVARAPNDVWTVDFKGWWRLGDGSRCEPLTVRDAHSRFLLAVSLPAKSGWEGVRAEFERLFSLYGLPRVIHSDNGSPFASVQAPLGLTRLSAWWVCLGIELDRGRPGHPQDNGAHERMHRDLEVEVARHAQPDAKMQQACFDVWREEYNWQRPHEALDGRTPGEVYHKSERVMPAAAGRLDYGAGFFVRQVTRQGTVKWHGERIFVSSALSGLQVGLRIIDGGQLEVWLNYLLIGTIDPQTSSFRGAPSRPTEAARLSA